jgi:L-alanine-DL-glutamate epimerase-like enolase superfamily enzyme
LDKCDPRSLDENTLALTLKVELEVWPLTVPFRIASGVFSESDLIVVTLSDGIHTGRGEGAPSFVYHQNPAQEIARIESQHERIEAAVSLADIQNILPPGPARNAVDCAYWDLEAKRNGSIWNLMNESPPPWLDAIMTIGVDEPAAMAAQAERLASFPFLKVKLNADRVLEKMSAIRSVAPNARLIVDVNEGWTMANLREYAPPLADMGVEMIEQPLHRDNDQLLAGYESPVTLCADESIRTRAELARVTELYQMVNIKLDKAGGLTESLALATAAREAGMDLMVGNMLGTSLSLAPAFVIGMQCKYCDLDGAMYYPQDREHGTPFKDGRAYLFSPALWG